MSFILICIAWYISGFSSFVYWWRKDFDLTMVSLGAGLMAGLIGPIAFLLGGFIHGGSRDFVVWRKRGGHE